MHDLTVINWIMYDDVRQPFLTSTKGSLWSPSCKIALSFAAIAFIVRPTSAIIWLPLCIWHMIWHAKNISKFLIVDVIPIAYFSQGFFVVAGTLTIPFIGGVLKSDVRQRFLIWIILWDILIHSCLSHKEFRFILSILPFVLCFCGSYLSIMWKVKDATVTRNRHSFWWFFTFLLTTNIAAAAYTSRIHQKGTIDAIHHIRTISERHNTDRFSVMFLMPCHSTPFYCYIHKKIELSFLTCLPSNRPGYIDEADRFFLEPTSWLNRKFNSSDTNNVVPPNCLVFFDNLVTVIQTFLVKYHYKKNKSFFHTHFPEGRRFLTLLPLRAERDQPRYYDLFKVLSQEGTFSGANYLLPAYGTYSLSSEVRK
ncbi:uncharacterized protein TRIADDRAFT_54751 [Trichoplax adhaerens]|uniref:Mannosyltransferase n=1 Tax=Trichoplax adhaerens TaxID=10228 RepID=B3RSW3_TRIAD|nr:hypothetical protein TRIADDRAFT_54751 [Trichoplax adhaerens]EDV26594.1 hypothetical protein TRIADDRAFT_54751 [Trichoplax adhaerens]|eukprot:XP_002110590.1 hypothetical protein TRIADDRAFT_54751 [Trichoplax adhaerens]